MSKTELRIRDREGPRRHASPGVETALRERNDDRTQTLLNPPHRLSRMLLIALLMIAMLAIAALELWAFWALGERERRRRTGSPRPRCRDPVPASRREPDPDGGPARSCTTGR